MSQLIDQLNEFATNVRRLPADEQQKFYQGVRSAIGPAKSSRNTGTNVFEVRDVALEDLMTQPGVVPTDLRQDFRELCKALNVEARKRGAAWSGESIHRMVTRFLLPQPTDAELLATPELVAAVARQLPSMQPPSIDLEKLSDMVASKLAEKAKQQPSQ